MLNPTPIKKRKKINILNFMFRHEVNAYDRLFLAGDKRKSESSHLVPDRGNKYLHFEVRF